MISRIKYVIIVLLTIALMPISVLASPSITLDVDKNELTIGDEIVVSAKTSDDLNPYALIATLKYDQKVANGIYESASENGIDGLDVELIEKIRQGD